MTHIPKRSQLPLTIDRASAVNTTAAHRDRILASAAINVTLPIGSATLDQIVIAVVNTDGTTITITPDATQSIFGNAIGTPISLTSQYDFIELYWSNTQNRWLASSQRISVAAPTIDLDPVLSIQNTPPITPTTGDRYLIGVAPTGAWVGNANNIAEWNGSAWVYTVAVNDNTVYVVDTLQTYRFNGANWILYTGVNLTLTGNLVARQIATVKETITVAGTTATLNFANGSYKTLNLLGSTGNVTLTLSNPIDTAGYTIEVIDHATTARTLTFPAGTISSDGGGNTFTASLPNTRYYVEMYYVAADPVIGAHYSFVVIPSFA